MDFKPIVEKVGRNKSLIKQAQRISNLVFDQNGNQLLKKEPKNPKKIETLIEEFITSLKLEEIVAPSTEIASDDVYENIIRPVILKLTN